MGAMLFANGPLVFAMLSTALPAGLADKGVFSTLDARVTLAAPDWIPREHVTLVADRARGVLTLSLGGEPVKAYPMAPLCAEDRLECLGLRDRDGAELRGILGGVGSAHPATATFVAPDFSDSDGDGIPDSVDILLGAKKAVLLHSAYRDSAPKLAYPGGDVPADVGVCTDVIVRALRNAGIDLQKEVFEDAGRAPLAYPGIGKRNPSLDHRRVRNLAVYFKRHWRPIQRREDLLPGDVVLLDTFPSKPGPDHIGIVSDILGPRRTPLIINAWTSGFFTEEMDLLPSIAMTIAYRAPAPRTATTAQPSDGNPHGLVLPASARQLVLVVTEGWNAPKARLSLWEKDEHGWQRHGPATVATVGAAGLGWGRGLHADEVTAALGGPHKREGDSRAPAGIFRLSSATGYARLPPAGTRLPYQQATDDLRCVDDPTSPDYNQLRSLTSVAATTPAWRSDEKMKRSDDQYRLTVVVDHNRAPVAAGAGSCIFLHAWPTPRVPSPGCTMMALTNVAKLVTWLDPRANPVLVQLPMPIAAKAAHSWGLRGGRP
jgi:L,D-peptidoglycan transpeptidase YkuD (ErfK/YbiS/YcfS/YnhG family)/uncharacterized protein YijF (DUF1287 family)